MSRKMIGGLGVAALAASALAVVAVMASGGAGEPGIAAQIGSRKITIAELDTKGLAEDLKTYQALYDTRKRVLDAMIAESLQDAEAKSRGITRDLLIAQEVTAKSKPVTNTDVSDFYEKNKAGMQGRTLEQMQAQIEAFLNNQSRQMAMDAFTASLRKKADVKILLDAPRVEVKIAAGTPSKGPADAPVQILEFSDFQCPYCSRVTPTLAKLVETYGDKVRIAFRDFPLPFHDKAEGAAEAAQCANAQGKFWPYHDKLFGNQGALAPENLKQYAADLGLDAAKFNDCLDKGEFKAAVLKNHQDGESMGVGGTPAFFVNGRFVSGAQPYEAFAAMVDEELQMAADRTRTK